MLSELPASVSVFVGSSRRDSQGGQTHRVLRFFKHPDYKQTRIPFFIVADIAVVRTISRINFGPLVQPIPLGRQFVPSGFEVMLTGWGALRNVSEDFLEKYC